MNRSTTLATLIVSQIVYILFIVVWLFMAGMSVMMFDSPDAAGEATPWLVFILILLYPLALVVALIVGWRRFARQRYKNALIWNGIPLLWIVPLVGFLIYANFS